MPIYEYACAACGHEFEEWQKMSDAPVKTCPKCKKKKVERLISRTAFQLKGGGWYADLYSSSKPGDSKGESAEKAEKSEKSEAAKDSGGASAKEASGGGDKDSSSKSSTKPSTSESSPKKKIAKKAESRAA